MKLLNSMLRHAFGAGSKRTLAAQRLAAGAASLEKAAPARGVGDTAAALRGALQRKGLGDVSSAERWGHLVVQLASWVGTRVVLDYGCGNQRLAVALVPKGLSVRGYDPTVLGLDTPPESADLAVCISLLQHVDPAQMGEVLSQLAACTRKVALVTASIRASAMPLAWWLERLSAAFDVLDVQQAPDAEFAALVAPKGTGMAIDFDQLSEFSARTRPARAVGHPAERLRIEWLMYGLSPSESAGTSHLASHRYRALLPAKFLEMRGDSVGFLHMEAMPGQVECDVVVITKLAETSMDDFRRIGTDVLAFANRARRQGVAVVVDVSDNFFDRPGQAEYWRALVRDATMCTVASDVMGDVVRTFTGAPVRVIGDSLGSPFGAPRVTAATDANGTHRLQRPLALVWYGNVNNFKSLQGWAEKLISLASRTPFTLTVVTAEHPTIEKWIKDFNARHGPDARATFARWSEPTQWECVAASDVVLIPSDPTNPDKLVKSANRLTDALHAGRYVVASPIPSYLPYEGFVTLTDAPLEAIEWYLQHGDDALHRIGEGQRYVIERCSDMAIGESWRGALAEARRLVAANPASDRDPVRLNLGCGDKVIPGYINVDVAASRAGQRPDVLCDLRALQPFDTASADEVMAIHVVEHFWRWEIEAVLREWVRVLKPGGRLIVECPNLEYACREFLRDPEQGARADAGGQLTMWVFYGDPRWKDPLMIHRWGYTPASLVALLESVGLIEVKQAPAQFKKREPRDMRVVGTKPLAP